MKNSVRLNYQTFSCFQEFGDLLVHTSDSLCDYYTLSWEVSINKIVNIENKQK
jgi:hypothetical protein